MLDNISNESNEYRETHCAVGKKKSNKIGVHINLTELASAVVEAVLAAPLYSSPAQRVVSPAHHPFGAQI